VSISKESDDWQVLTINPWQRWVIQNSIDSLVCENYSYPLYIVNVKNQVAAFSSAVMYYIYTILERFCDYLIEYGSRIIQPQYSKRYVLRESRTSFLWIDLTEGNWKSFLFLNHRHIVSVRRKNKLRIN